MNDEQPTEPEQVTLTIENGTGGPVWTYDNTRIWGFGFDGTIDLVDGRIVARSEGRFPSNASMIVMARFEKGLFQPVISLDKPFSSMEKKAKKGSSYKRFDPVLLLFALGFILFFGGLLVGGIWVLVARLCGFVWKKSFFGKRKITEWFRDAPFGGDIFSSYYVLDKGRRFSGHSPQTNIVGAFFLKWILDGKVRVQTDERNKKKTSLVMGEVPPEFDTDEEAALFRMALEAAGENRILEPSEFENWSKKHYAQMANWPGKVSSRGLANLIGKKLAKGLKGMTADGQREAVHVVEFKNFLSDFTLVDQREAAEVGLWKEYLVYAQLYGIADKVMAQLKKLFPVQFDAYARQAGMDPYVLNTTVRRMNTMSRTSFQNASASQAAAQAAQAARAAGGRGGRTSFGGGGGFSGGGHGGGSR